MIRVEGLASLADYDGALHPAIGDLDGDGLREIVVGLGAGGAGRIHALDDSTTGFTAIAGPAELDGGFHAGWAPYDAANGSTRVSLADVDGDDLAEVAVGFGEGGEHMLRLLDDVNTGFEPSTQSSAIEALVDFGEGQLVRPALNP